MRFTPGRLTALALAIFVGSCSSPTVALNPINETEIRGLFLFQSAPSATFGGHGFLLERESGKQPLALTANHVAGGLSTAWLRNVEGTLSVRLGERVPIAGAQTIGASGAQHDVAAFRVLDWDPLRALSLGSEMPAVGDTVWVLALHIGDHPASGPRRHPARVAVSDDTEFIYAYLASANSNYTSGAAVLDRSGRVVGINVGSVVTTAASWQGYRDRHAGCCAGMRGGEVAGIAVHLRSLRTHLSSLP